MNMKKTVLAVFAVLLVLTGLLFLRPKEWEEGYVRVQFHASQYHNKRSDTTTIVWDDRVVGTFPGKLLQWTRSNLGNSCAFLTAEQELYYLCSQKMIRIANGAERFSLSDDGLSLEYTDSAGKNFRAENLLAEDGPKIMAAAVEEKRLWTEWDSIKPNQFWLYGMVNGKPARIADNMYPKIFDRYVFGYREVEIEKEPYSLNNLYRLSTGGKITPVAENIHKWIFSRDGGQMLYSDLENTYLYQAKTGESRLLCAGRRVTLLEPPLCAHREYDDFGGAVFTVEIYNSDSLYDIRTDMYHLDDNLQVHLLVENVLYEQLSLDGKTLWYWVEGEGIYRQSVENPADRVLLIKNPRSWAIPMEGTCWYWTDEQDNLWGCDGINTRQLAEEVNFYNNERQLTADGRLMFLAGGKEDTGGNLYICRGIEDPVLIAENVIRFDYQYIYPQYTVRNEDKGMFNTYALRTDGTSVLLYTVESVQ